MRVCPECHRLYDDPGLTTCPDDGATLFTPKPANAAPRLEVQPAGPSDETAVIDIHQLSQAFHKEHPPSESPSPAPQQKAPAKVKSPISSQSTAAKRKSRSRPLGQSTNGAGISWLPSFSTTVIILTLLGVGFGLFQAGVHEYRIPPIETSPTGALVSVDGQEYGESPVRLFLRQGEHTLIINKTGFEPMAQKINLLGLYQSVFHAFDSAGSASLERQQHPPSAEADRTKRRAARTQNMLIAEGKVREGQRLLSMGDLKEASDLLIEATRLSPENPTPYLLLARIAALQSDNDSAIELGERYIHLGGADEKGQVASWLAQMKARMPDNNKDAH